MANKLNSDSFDIKKALKEEGVYAYGFGHIAKAAMFDRDISPTAKGIYAYLCSFTNAKNIAYPKLSTILSDLNINKRTYYIHFEQLIKYGYITIKKAEGYKNKNVYIINEYVKKVNCDITEDEESDSIFIVDGIKAHGYGTVPKLAMIDKRLTIKAKALMAFLLSLTGAGKKAFPRRDVICTRLGVNKNTYTSMMNELIRYGYIKVTQRRTRHGNFSINDYHFEINPVEIDELVVTENSDADNSTIVENNVESCGKEESTIQNNEVPSHFNNIENGLNSEFSPCPKNCTFLTGHRVLKTAPSPCPKNCTDNNINNNNNTSMISSSILLPNNKVINDKPDGEELKITLHRISRYDEYSNYSDSYAKKYCKTVDILIALFSENQVLYKGQKINTYVLWECFVKILKVDYSTETSCVDFIFDVLIYFNNCLSMYHIEHPARYLRSLLIDKLITAHDDNILL